MAPTATKDTRYQPVLTTLVESAEKKIQKVVQKPDETETNQAATFATTAPLATAMAGLTGKKPLERHHEVTQLETFCRLIGIQHWVLLMLLFIYTLIGGAIFEAIERPEEIASYNQEKDTAGDDSSLIAWNITKYFNDTLYKDEEKCDLMDWRRDLEHVNKTLYEFQGKKGVFNDEGVWRYLPSTMFAWTLFTTIGYGNQAPKTVGGRVFTIIYSLIGIPFCLIVLDDFGKMLRLVLKAPWNRIRDYVKAKKGTSDPETDKGKGTTQEQEELPMTLAFIIFLLWWLFCAAVFYAAEKKYTYFESLYFFYISLSTIGLGDIVPSPDSALTLIAFPMLIIGLSFMSLMFNLLQIKLANAKAYAQEELEELIGWDTDSSEDESSMPTIDRIRTNLGVIQLIRPQFSGPANTNITEAATSKTNLSVISDGAENPMGSSAGLAGTGKRKRRRRGTQTDASYVQYFKAHKAGQFASNPYYDSRQAIIDRLNLEA